MTYKDCIHDEICVFRGKGNCPDECAQFKDKARFVELQARTNALKPCPFCGGEFEIVLVDNDGNIRRTDGEFFGITHNVPHHSCPIATTEGELVGDVFYLFVRGAEEAINRRFT